MTVAVAVAVADPGCGGNRVLCWRWVGLFLGALCLSGRAARAQDHSFLPGSAWGLVLPDGFARQDTPVPHFSHPDRAYIVVQELFESLDDQGLGPAGTLLGDGAQAIRIEAFQDLQPDDRRTLLWSGRNVSSGDVILMAFVEGPTSIASVTAVVNAASAVDKDGVRAALMTATPRVVPDEDRFALFPVVLRDPAGFRIARFQPDLLLLTEDGQYSDTTQYQGRFVTVAAHPKQPGERVNVAETRVVLRDLVETRFPAGRQTATDVIQTGHGQAVTSHFAFTQPGGAQFDGEALFMTTACCTVGVVAAYPAGQQDMPERFRRIWQSISNRN